MNRHLVLPAALALLLPCAAPAQTGPALSELTGRGLAPMAAADVQALIPGTKMLHTSSSSGNARAWTNEPDGTFMATASNPNRPRGREGTAKGTWRIDESGRYCAKMQWREGPEDWCRFLLKDGERYFAVGSMAKPEALTHEFRISR